MEFLKLDLGKQVRKLQAGKLLIAEPLLNDPNFSRSVVFLCEHGPEGSVGFVLNQLTELTLQDILPEIVAPGINIYTGGPVQADTVHMVHRLTGINGGVQVENGIFWGGSYDSLKEAMWSQGEDETNIRLFMGYSGWGPGQLENEMQEGSWLIADATPELLFDTDPTEIWKTAIRSLEKKYHFLSHLPTDPQLN